METTNERTEATERELGVLSSMIYLLPVCFNAAASDRLAELEEGLEGRGLLRHTVKFRVGEMFRKLDRCTRNAAACFRGFYSLPALAAIGTSFCREADTDLLRMQAAVDTEIGRVLPHGVDPWPLARAMCVELVCALSAECTRHAADLFARLAGTGRRYTVSRLAAHTGVDDALKCAAQLRHCLAGLDRSARAAVDDVRVDDIRDGLKVLRDRATDPAFMQRVIDRADKITKEDGKIEQE